MKHTKGPWEYHEVLGAQFSMISGDGVVIAGIPNAIIDTDDYTIDLETNRANAYLIASAPELKEENEKQKIEIKELLEALKDLAMVADSVATTENTSVMDSQINIAEQAIAKAERK